MTVHRSDLEARLGELRRATLPAELEKRVLGAAAFAAAPDWRDRAWYSWGWRLAAAAFVVALLLIDRWAVRPPAVPTDRAEVQTAADAAALAEPVGLSAAQVERLLSRVDMVSVTAPDRATAEHGRDVWDIR